MKAIICDLDGTLFDNSHRQHFITNGKKDWKSFNSAEEIKKDQVKQWCYNIIRHHRQDHHIYFVTGRMGSKSVADETTIRILTLFSGNATNLSLHMRKDGDFRDDTIIKKEIYDMSIKPNHEIAFCIDDRQRVVDMWREEGLVCLQCAKGDF